MPRDKHGRFLPGPDAARHTFTRAQRRKGYRVAVLHMQTRLGLLEGEQWVLMEVRGWYRSRPGGR